MNISSNSEAKSLSRICQEAICRRAQRRARLEPSMVRCWSDLDRPTQVNAIEIDGRGARLLLPWYSEPGDFIQVCLCDQLGQYDTRSAVVVWTQAVGGSNRVVAGLAFAEEMMAA